MVIVAKGEGAVRMKTHSASSESFLQFRNYTHLLTYFCFVVDSNGQNLDCCYVWQLVACRVNLFELIQNYVIFYVTLTLTLNSIHFRVTLFTSLMLAIMKFTVTVAEIFA